uniref:E3 ubiquitin-protein ligase MARCHF5 n=1 Tax=Plectus sambesii TaxID=2011161 RepID=A0A914WS79_9BILA
MTTVFDSDFPKLSPSTDSLPTTSQPQPVPSSASSSQQTNDTHPNPPNLSSIPSVDAFKSCWVCFATEEDDPTAKWLSPCKCKGSTKWVHESCLQRWVDEKQRGNILTAVACAQCNYIYRLVLPAANVLLQMLENMDRFVARACPLLTGGVILGSVYWSAVTYGAVTIMEILGYKRALHVMEKTDPMVLIIGLPTIPILLVVGRMIRYEEALVRIVDRTVNRQKLDGQEVDRSLEQQQQQQLRNQRGLPVSTATRTFIGALAFPTIAVLVGKCIVASSGSKVVWPHWKQALIGGTTFLAAKAVCKVYLHYKQLVRRRNRRILQFDDVLAQETQNEAPYDEGDDDELIDEGEDELLGEDMGP